jgi:hypothetical protein
MMKKERKEYDRIRSKSAVEKYLNKNKRMNTLCAVLKLTILSIGELTSDQSDIFSLQLII